jgi:hypothetical protein
MKTAKNLAQSVGIGLLTQEGILQKESLKRDGGVLGNLADDANLPDVLPDQGRESFNLCNFCELCERNFNKISLPRHHCRKCNKSVCNQCSNNKRKLSKQNDQLLRVCDFCDTQLSNFKLEQNQLIIIKAQEEQM